MFNLHAFQSSRAPDFATFAWAKNFRARSFQSSNISKIALASPERPISEWPIPEGDHSPNDHSQKATILRTTNFRKRPILGRLIIVKPELNRNVFYTHFRILLTIQIILKYFWVQKSMDRYTNKPWTDKPMTQQTQDSGHYTVLKLLHILPDFLSLLHLIFHLYHRRQVHNIWIELWLNLGFAPGL
jgi:hypothetical protein